MQLILKIATRESRLALWQAEHVKALLENQGHKVELLGMTTTGDKILDRTLSKVGGKGLFVKELESALLEGRADLAVHSLKDVPMQLPPDFYLSCVMQREDVRDAFVSNEYKNLSELPNGAVIGTSSLRREALLRNLLSGMGRADIQIAPLRGNLDTRLSKLDSGQYAAIILAAAGLKRLGLADRIKYEFPPEEMLPAAGQGALGIEIYGDKKELSQALEKLACPQTWISCAAERAVSRQLGGSCSMPLAAYAQITENQINLRAAFGKIETSSLIKASGQAELKQDIKQNLEENLKIATKLGEQIANQLKALGAN